MQKRDLIIAAALVSVVSAYGIFNWNKNKTRQAPTAMSNSAYKTTPSGLKYLELQEGIGAVAQKGRPVQVHYTGWLFDEKAPEFKGTKFDSSVDRGQPFQFNLGAGMVIRGWDEGVAGMKVGEKRRLIIPANLAYGNQSVGGIIPANATLVFDVELLRV